MNNTIKLASTIALITLFSASLIQPAKAFDFNSILQSLSHGVSGWTDLDARETEISAQLDAAASSGQLSSTEADGFKSELNRVMQVETQIKASGRQLSATDSISFTNSLNNLTNRINLAITNKTTANSTSLAAVQTLRAQLNSKVDQARAAHTLTRADADNIKHDLEHNSSVETAFTTSSTNGALTSRQTQLLADDLGRIKLAIEQHLIVAQSGEPQLAAQRTAIERKIANGVSARTIGDNQAARFRQELQRIADMQANFLQYDGALSANEVLTIASELDRLSGRVEYQDSMGANYSSYGDDRGYGRGNGGDGDRYGNGYGRGGRRQPDHTATEIETRRDQILARITAAQNQTTLLKQEVDAITQRELRFKNANGGNLDYDQSAQLWTDLSGTDQRVTEQLSGRVSQTSTNR